VPHERQLLRDGIRHAVSLLPESSLLAKAALLGVSPSTLDRWTAGATAPRSAALRRLAAKSGLSVEVIRNGGRPIEDAAA
jgi:DNA-binding transcriptional regulator YdaS (Cro superfamily)